MKAEHLWPGEAAIDFQRTMESLRIAPQVRAPVLWESRTRQNNGGMENARNVSAFTLACESSSLSVLHLCEPSVLHVCEFSSPLVEHAELHAPCSRSP